MYLACTALAAAVGKDASIADNLMDLIPTGERIIKAYEEKMREIGQNHDLQRYFFLGSGIRYGLACEASLKMKKCP